MFLFRILLKAAFKSYLVNKMYVITSIFPAKMTSLFTYLSALNLSILTPLFFHFLTYFLPPTLLLVHFLSSLDICFFFLQTYFDLASFFSCFLPSMYSSNALCYHINEILV